MPVHSELGVGEAHQRVCIQRHSRWGATPDLQLSDLGADGLDELDNRSRELLVFTEIAHEGCDSFKVVLYGCEAWRTTGFAAHLVESLDGDRAAFETGQRRSYGVGFVCWSIGAVSHAVAPAMSLSIGTLAPEGPTSI